MNTRKFPRTLGEAFKGLDYSCAVERPQPRYPRTLWVVMALGFVVGLLATRS